MTTKSEILAEIARSRADIVSDAASLRAELDVATRVKKSVVMRPFAWLGSAAALGYMLAGPKTRTKTVIKTVRDAKTGTAHVGKKPSHTFLDILFGFFKLALPLLKPLITAYATRRVGAFAEKLQRP
ncbi:MAG: hypothetical protein WCK39_09815 [Methanomassiliicoccales archaeon]